MLHREHTIYGKLTACFAAARSSANGTKRTRGLTRRLRNPNRTIAGKVLPSAYCGEPRWPHCRHSGSLSAFLQRLEASLLRVCRPQKPDLCRVSVDHCWSLRREYRLYARVVGRGEFATHILPLRFNLFVFSGTTCCKRCEYDEEDARKVKHFSYRNEPRHSHL